MTPVQKNQFIAAILGIIVGLWVVGGIYVFSGTDSPQPRDLQVKVITVMDKVDLNGGNLIYTTDREIFSTENLFLYRELAVNGTYLIEYRPLDSGKALNVKGIRGCIQALEAVPDA